MTEEFKSLPLTPMRRLIAARMVESKRDIPHFRLTVDLEMDRFVAFREHLVGDRPDTKLSLNDLLVKACAMALTDEPGVNVQWADTEIREISTADISVIMAVEGGLSTPVIRQANLKSVWAIAEEVRELGGRARAKTLKMHEIAGGSFSMSNLGMYGIDQFDAIINPPQCAILAVGAVKPRVVVSPSGGVRVAAVMTATLSCDHRAVDGVVGARFLRALRKHVESPSEVWAR